MNNSLRFGWDADLIVMNYFFKFQWILEAFVLLFLHSTILLILLSKRTVMSSGIRRGYIIDQIFMIFFGWTICYIVKMYPTYPWPGFYCDGLICRLFPNIRSWIVMLLSAFAIIAVVPCFQYISFRVYTSVVSVSDARFYVSQRAQHMLLFISTAILGVNVVTFAVLGEEPDFVQDIYNTPEMETLLATRGGRVIIFGRPGDPGMFTYEVYIIFASVILILPVISIMTFYARSVIRNREVVPCKIKYNKMISLKKTVSSRTHKVEDRLAKIVSVFIFYCIPLVFMVGLMMIDTSKWPPWLLAIIRPTIMMLLSLKSTVQSMIFLLKNPLYTKRIFQQVFDLAQRRKQNDTEMTSVRTKPSASVFRS